MLRPLSLSIFLVVVAWTSCVSVPEHPPRPLQENALHLVEVGTRGQAGNLLVIQGFVDTGDYASAWNYSAKIENYLEQAQQRGWLGPKTVVLLPARWADFLVFADEALQVFQVSSLDEAVRYTMQGRWLDAAMKGVTAPADDRLAYALWSSKGAGLAVLYQKLFSKIARAYKITLVASTVILPSPQIKDGRIVVDETGELRRCAFVFAADGELMMAPTCQTDLSPGDRRLLAPGRDHSPIVYETSAGRMAVLIGDDLFDGRQDAALAAAKVDLLLAPQAVLQANVWQEPWPEAARFSGASGGTEHSSQSRAQVTPLLGLVARLRESRAHAGAVAYLRGRLWSQGTDGQSLVAKGDLIQAGPHTDAPVLMNLWLGDEPKPVPLTPPAPKKLSPEEEEALLPGLTWPGGSPSKKKTKKKRSRRRRAR